MLQNHAKNFEVLSDIPLYDTGEKATNQQGGIYIYLVCFVPLSAAVPTDILSA